jgi:hypothetical protein
MKSNKKLNFQQSLITKVTKYLKLSIEYEPKSCSVPPLGIAVGKPMATDGGGGGFYLFVILITGTIISSRLIPPC